MSDALINNTAFLEDALGFEAAGRACAMLLAEDLNDEIARRADKWKSADLEYQVATGSLVGQVDLEEFPAGAFHEGPHRSFMDAPPSSFPNVSVMAYITQPTIEQFDQLDTVQLRLFVETCVKAGPVADGSETEFETIVHRRIQRSTEAVHAVIRRSKNLRGTVNPIQLPPRGGIGQQSWARREEKGRGPRFMWQGSRLEYTLDRHASLS